MSTTHTYPWLIPIIKWCRQFLSLSTNILSIKSKLKLELRAISQSLLPCHHIILVASITVDPPLVRKVQAPVVVFFLQKAEHVNGTAPEWLHCLVTMSLIIYTHSNTSLYAGKVINKRQLYITNGMCASIEMYEINSKCSYHWILCQTNFQCYGLNWHTLPWYLCCMQTKAPLSPRESYTSAPNSL